MLDSSSSSSEELSSSSSSEEPATSSSSEEPSSSSSSEEVLIDIQGAFDDDFIPSAEKNDPGGVVLLAEVDESAQIRIQPTGSEGDTRTLTWDPTQLDVEGETSPLTLAEEDGEKQYTVYAQEALYPDETDDETSSAETAQRAAIDVKVTDAAGVEKRSDSVTAKKAEIAIYRDDKKFSGVENISVYAGEVLSLEVRLEDDPENTKYPTDIKWEISGKRLKDYNPAKEQNQKTELTSEDLTKKAIEFHWISGDLQKIEVSGKVGGATVTVSQSVNVMRPTVTITATSDGTMKGTFETGKVFITTHLRGAGGTRTQRVSAGGAIHFEATETGENIPGDKAWLQKINFVNQTSELTDGGQAPPFTVSNGLDIAFPYPGSNTDSAQDRADRRWERPDRKSFASSYNFTMYYLFRASSVSGAKWIPLRKVDWVISADGQCIDSNPPLNRDPWTGQSTMSINPADAEALVAPTWDNVIPINPQ